MLHKLKNHRSNRKFLKPVEVRFPVLAYSFMQKDMQNQVQQFLLINPPSPTFHPFDKRALG